MLEYLDNAAYAGSAYLAEKPVIRVRLSSFVDHELASVQQSAAATGAVPFGKPAHELPGLCVCDDRSRPVVAFPTAIPGTDNHDAAGHGTADLLHPSNPPAEPRGDLQCGIPRYSEIVAEGEQYRLGTVVPFRKNRNRMVTSCHRYIILSDIVQQPAHPAGFRKNPLRFIIIPASGKKSLRKTTILPARGNYEASRFFRRHSQGGTGRESAHRPLRRSNASSSVRP